MALTTMTASSNTGTENAKREGAAAEIARTLQTYKKCKYCNYEHWDEFDLKFHQEMHKEYCEEKEVKRQRRRAYEIMLMNRLNLKKEIRSLCQNFVANEKEINAFETDEDTREFACEVRERVWENRTRENWRSDTSFVGELLE